MRTGFFLALTATTLASMSCTTTVAAVACDLNEIVPALLPLISDDNYFPCQLESAYTFYPFSGLPTSDQEFLMCASTACRALFAIAQANGLPSCDLELGGGSAPFNLRATIDRVLAQCPAA